MSPGGRGKFSDEKQTIITKSKQEIKDSILKMALKQLSVKLDYMKIDSIKTITTENGFKSIMDWSDSLRDKEFISSLSNNLSHFNVFNLTDYDSSVTLSLGESDMVLGATGGYLFLKKDNHQLKIDQFRGGK